MITIAEPYLRYSSTLTQRSLELTAGRVLECVEPLVRGYYVKKHREFEVRVFIRIELGSTKVWVTVSAAVGVLLFYGDLRQSIDFLIKDARSVAAAVSTEVGPAIGWRNRPPTYLQRRLGLPGQLQRLFLEVQRHEIGPDEATSRAIQLLYERDPIEIVDLAPVLTQSLSREFQDAAREQPVRMGSGQRRRGPNRTLPPADLPLPARRRTGVIVHRDEKSGDLKVTTY